MENKYDAYGKDNELNLKVIIGLYRSHLMVNRNTQRLLAEEGLTASQFGVLEALYHLGDLKICDLIEKTLSTSGNMTVVIKNLENEGYIVRLRDSEDQRAFRIHLSDKGKSLIETIFPRHLIDIEKSLSCLDHEDKVALHHLLKKLNGL